MPHSFRSAILFFVGNVVERIGYSRNHRGFMLTSRVEEKVDLLLLTCLKLIDAMGGTRVLESPVLNVTEDEDEKFDEKYMDMRSPFVVLITGAQYGPSKRWPDSYFSELADRIVKDLNMSVNILLASARKSLHVRFTRGWSIRSRWL